jgi:hypothetical protein
LCCQTRINFATTPPLPPYSGGRGKLPFLFIYNTLSDAADAFSINSLIADRAIMGK